MTPTDPAETPDAETLPGAYPLPTVDASDAAGTAGSFLRRRDVAAGTMPKGFAAPLRLLALGNSAMCGSLGAMQVVLYFFGIAEGSGLWVVVLSVLAGVAAVLLALGRSAAVGAGAGLGVAALAFVLWMTAAICNGIMRDTEVLLLLPIFLG